MAKCKTFDHNLVFQSADETKEVYKCSVCGEKEIYSKCGGCGKYVYTLFERGLCSVCLSNPTPPNMNIMEELRNSLCSVCDFVYDENSIGCPCKCLTQAHTSIIAKVKEKVLLGAWEVFTDEEQLKDFKKEIDRLFNGENK